MTFEKNDIVVMKKQHPCKQSNEFKVLRVGVDAMLKCLGCESIVTIQREQFNKRVKYKKEIKE